MPVDFVGIHTLYKEWVWSVEKECIFCIFGLTL